MCGRVGAGELTFESYSVGKHSAAAPAVVSAHSQLSATRSATLLHAARRWVHLLLALVAVGLRLLASPIALVELYRTDQVWHVGGGRVGHDRYPTTRSGTNLSFPQTYRPPTAGPTLKPREETGSGRMKMNKSYTRQSKHIKKISPKMRELPTCGAGLRRIRTHCATGDAKFTTHPPAARRRCPYQTSPHC